MLRPGIWNQKQAEYDDPNQPSQAKSWQVILAFSDSSCSEQVNTQTVVRISQESESSQSHSQIKLSLSLCVSEFSHGLSLHSRTSPSLVLIRSTVRPSLGQFNGLAKEKSIAGNARQLDQLKATSVCLNRSWLACTSGNVLSRARACPNRLEGCFMKQCNSNITWGFEKSSKPIAHFGRSTVQTKFNKCAINAVVLTLRCFRWAVPVPRKASQISDVSSTACKWVAGLNITTSWALPNWFFLTDFLLFSTQPPKVTAPSAAPACPRSP